MLQGAEDAMGHAYWDELHGRPAWEIVERDDGYVDCAPISAYFEPFEDWHETTRQAMGFVRGRVLDLGVGAGRHALHLQSQGHDVVGIDVSSLAVEVARQRGLEDARGQSVTQVGGHLGCFETFLLMGNNFGLLANRRRGRWLLGRLASIGAPDARIVAQTLDPYATDNPEHEAYQEQNRRRGRLPGQIHLRIRYRHYRTPWFDYLFVSPEEMEDLVRGTPWRIREVLGESEDPHYTALLERRSG